MSELQIGLLAIGVLVVAGVLAYNRVQERGAKRDAERAFRSAHVDVLLEEGGTAPGVPTEAVRKSARPDPAIDYIIEFASAQPAAHATLREQWSAVERRHARRALLEESADGGSWRAALQLVSRDGAIGEADLIEFRSAVETLAASIGATVSAPEMRTAVEAARALDEFCAETDIQVVIHLQGGPFAGSAIGAAAAAAGMALGRDGRFEKHDDSDRLLYTLAARDASVFSATSLSEARAEALTLTLDLARAPDTQRCFESMARFARQLATALGGSIVDDNGNTLDERAVAAIATQLEAVRARLEAQGVAPGSPTALRLFS